MELLRVDVLEQSQVAAARRAVVGLAQQLGLDDAAQARVALVVTEAATNLVKHARDGQLLARPVTRDGAPAAVEILAIDRGGGLGLPGRALHDGYSTSGTLGVGLGAMQRQADAFAFDSSAAGLVVAMRIDGAPRPAGTDGIDVGAVCVRKPGETACGDDWTVRSTPSGWLAVVVDGLGHGPEAARAAAAALAAVDEAVADPALQMQRLHEALRPTRGAAVGVAIAGDGRLGFCGVGNVVCRVRQGGRERQLVTHAGIVGHSMRKAVAFWEPLGPQAIVVLHSDGLNTRCAIEAHPGLDRREASVIAGVLYRDHLRGGDDATVVVVRPDGGPAR